MLGAVGGLAALGGIAGCSGGSVATRTAASTPASSGQQDKLAVVLLGTQAGPPVDPGRAGIATALVVDGATYVVDCGRAATTRYVEAGLRLDSLRGIFLTHLHADHVADYYNFFLLGGHIKNILGDTLAGPVPVYGPGPADDLPPKFGGGTAPTVAPKSPTPGTAEMTTRLHQAYAYSDNIFLRDMSIRDIRTLADVHEIALPSVGAGPRNTAPATPPFPVMEDDRVKVTATLVPHGPVFPSFAFRFDTDHGSVTFSGDTRTTDNLTTLARGTDMLVHEAINVRDVDLSPADLEHMLQSHVEVQEVGSVAQKADAAALVLSHISNLGSPVDTARWEHMAAKGYDRPVTVGTDLQRLVIA
ncbi:ribonuclease BN (tRNA processing enzyme) [Prauserella isguenensis]|uniref:Ribonuclease BN (tRNA processing enzyme) n=1 Tax=Prauserella isguenensis TaxID=1470180 RepID=A0A839S0H2_9PSEU|nr:ribonuclease BN (tRNA processing enzyme) [Prauserella isguenensis]